MVVLNTLSEIGDQILFETETPILGITEITGYTEELLGELVDRYFVKEFTYSVDGINYYDWQPLNLTNLQALVFPGSSIFKIQYRYTRAGTNTTGLLIFVKIELDGLYEDIECPDIFQRSIFARFFNCQDLRLIEWSINVLEKIYKPGIVPNYIERGANSNLDFSDQDYMALWKTFTDFFAMIVLYAREIGDFQGKQDLLELYLKNKGLYFPNNITYDELHYLMERFNREISYRGASEVFKKKGDDGRIVDGEFLRLINYNIHNEFNGGVVEPEKAFWVVNNSSPLYEGTNSAVNFIKGYEYTENVESLDAYPLVRSDYISLLANNIIIENVLAGDVSGIGISPLSVVMNKPIIVDKTISYEISFWIMSTDVINTPISFGVRGFDRYGTPIDFLKISDLTIETNLFFEKEGVNQNSVYYFCRGIIYKNTQAELTADEGLLNLGIGSNLRFQGNIELIIPYLSVDNESGIANAGPLFIWDFKIRPLELPFSTGFIGLDNLMVLWCKNNNKQYSNEELEDLAKYYLFPYNLFSEIIWL